ncbi:MAG: hypothetical protein HY644_03975 [Acidobacteria bacterium]|nr:hypothetical protein [Acidobacteriota bacterium]
MNPKLTVNLGLRWEFVTSPTEVAGRIANLRDIFHDTEPTIGDPFFQVSKANLEESI